MEDIVIPDRIIRVEFAPIELASQERFEECTTV